MNNQYPPTIHEAALIMDRSLATLWGYIRAGKMKSIKIGGKIYIKRTEINKYFKGENNGKSTKGKRSTRQNKRRSK